MVTTTPTPIHVSNIRSTSNVITALLNTNPLYLADFEIQDPSGICNNYVSRITLSSLQEIQKIIKRQKEGRTFSIKQLRSLIISSLPVHARELTISETALTDKLKEFDDNHGVQITCESFTASETKQTGFPVDPDKILSNIGKAFVESGAIDVLNTVVTNAANQMGKAIADMARQYPDLFKDLIDQANTDKSDKPLKRFLVIEAEQEDFTVVKIQLRRADSIDNAQDIFSTDSQIEISVPNDWFKTGRGSVFISEELREIAICGNGYRYPDGKIASMYINDHKATTITTNGCEFDIGKVTVIDLETFQSKERSL